MQFPQILNPANWDETTRRAAKDVVKVAIIFAITLVTHSSTGQEAFQTAVKRLPWNQQ